MSIEQFMAGLKTMKQYLADLGFTTQDCQIHLQSDGKLYVRVVAGDSWQKLDLYARVGQLDWSEFFDLDETSLSQIINLMWEQIYSVKPLDERELNYTMKKLSGLAELDLSSEFGKLLASRCKAMYEEAKSLQLTYQQSGPTGSPAQPDDEIPF